MYMCNMCPYLHTHTHTEAYVCIFMWISKYVYSCVFVYIHMCKLFIEKIIHEDEAPAMVS